MLQQDMTAVSSLAQGLMSKSERKAKSLGWVCALKVRERPAVQVCHILHQAALHLLWICSRGAHAGKQPQGFQQRDEEVVRGTHALLEAHVQAISNCKAPVALKQ